MRQRESKMTRIIIKEPNRVGKEVRQRENMFI